MYILKRIAMYYFRPGKHCTIYILIVLAIVGICFMGEFYSLIYRDGTPMNVMDGTSCNNNLSGLCDRNTDSDIYIQRKSTLERSCKTKPYIHNNKKLKMTKRKYLLFNKKNNFLFCFVQKIGCTFWKRIFLAMENVEIKNISDMSIVHKYRLPTLFRFSDNEVVELSKSTFSVLFVRDPYSRLFSGYVDKFLYPNVHYWRIYGVHIINKYRKNPTRQSLECGHDVTFAEFIEYVVDVYEQKRHMLDDHFSPIHQHCRPCEINYKIIGKMETFEDDANYIFNELPRFESRNLLFKRNLTEELIQVVADRNLNKSCLNNSETSTGKRILKSLYYRGLIDYNAISETNFINILKLKSDSKIGEYANLLSSKQKKTDKRKHMVGYYKSLNNRLLYRVRGFVKPDCKLFGYDDRPADIFSS